ncbi:hypothetical protein RRG08_055913 [Elysia crispata]|uniref:Uncharacterized protein n=1 Tax=Elysia crispata TaxID=231223 RepID=A0AAE0Y416_9GAST|nr:hypothetical protein RRG08_055913 [Elysia crispata]
MLRRRRKWPGVMEQVTAHALEAWAENSCPSKTLNRPFSASECLEDRIVTKELASTVHTVNILSRANNRTAQPRFFYTLELQVPDLSRSSDRQLWLAGPDLSETREE